MTIYTNIHHAEARTITRDMRWRFTESDDAPDVPAPPEPLEPPEPPDEPPGLVALHSPQNWRSTTGPGGSQWGPSSPSS